MKVVRGPVSSIFVGAWQYYPYAELGAPGFWTYHCWMGPGPLLRLRDAVRARDTKLARDLTLELTSAYEGPEPPDVRWRETAAKIAIGRRGIYRSGSAAPPLREDSEGGRPERRTSPQRWKAFCKQYEAAQA